ncbi:hypothetical protein [Pseudalkalibacillus caeni]|uniref:Uncharacterized protein n=1 Tax=Exobacillus caeni TaxID=2574798 RepID=A0A5R9FDC9_9BACL|nr:hypothetical protein [Pseudalkalibacillus caeni]TLS38564.1 hypothetical protein FCL54_05365 [Pseudalkalibacillus caeni]
MNELQQEELQHIVRFIILPYVKKVIELDLSNIKKISFKLPGPYIRLLELTMARVSYDLKESKFFLRRASIKVMEGKQSRGYIEYTIYHRGYEKRFNYSVDRIRNKVENLLYSYLSNPHPGNVLANQQNQRFKSK